MVSCSMEVVRTNNAFKCISRPRCPATKMWDTLICASGERPPRRFYAHCTREPTPSPSQEGSNHGWPVPFLGGVGGGLVPRRFMGWGALNRLGSLLGCGYRDFPSPRSFVAGRGRRCGVETALFILLCFGLSPPLGAWSEMVNWQRGAGFRWIELTVPAVGKTGFTLVPMAQTGISFTNSLADTLIAQNRIL